MIVYAVRALIVHDEGGSLLYLPSEEEHKAACRWLDDNDIVHRQTNTIAPAFNAGYDTIPCIEIRCKTAAVLAKMRWV